MGGEESVKKKLPKETEKTIFQSHNRLTSDVLEWQKVWNNEKTSKLNFDV